MSDRNRPPESGLPSLCGCVDAQVVDPLCSSRLQLVERTELAEHQNIHKQGAAPLPSKDQVPRSLASHSRSGASTPHPQKIKKKGKRRHHPQEDTKRTSTNTIVGWTGTLRDLSSQLSRNQREDKSKGLEKKQLP
eukprot:3655009-Amphidinium_carterae.1